MEQHLLKHVPAPRERVHFLNGLATDLDRECARFEAAIRDAGGIDLLIAGIGTNGHMAFNEPGSPMDSRTRVVQLADDTPGPLRRAMTMGIGTIMEARAILLLASGTNKAEAMCRALAGKPDIAAVPASALQRHPNLTVIADDAAGQQLRRTIQQR
jgi:glucosamine-6-phosphate deaminase